MVYCRARSQDIGQFTATEHDAWPHVIAVIFRRQPSMQADRQRFHKELQRQGASEVPRPWVTFEWAGAGGKIDERRIEDSKGDNSATRNGCP